MLITDINTLQTVYTLYFTKHVILYRTDSLDFQQVMRVNTTFCQFVAGFQYLSVHNLDSGTIGDQISFGLTGFIIGNDNLTFFLGILNDRNPSELSDNRKSFGLSGLKKLLNTGKTLCDIITGNTAGMEGTHGKLCTGLTDRLCSDDTYCFTYLNSFTSSHVGAVALRTDTVSGTAA